MKEFAQHTKALRNIMAYADAITGEWDGDNAGREEDRATAAEEVMEMANDLLELILALEEM
jgi:hypothetical protein